MLSNSSLQAWGDFETYMQNSGFHIDGAYFQSHPATLQPCSSAGVNANCLTVCLNESDLFDSSAPHNLVTCGIFTELQGLHLLGDISNKTVFTQLGLSENVSGIGDILSSCFQTLYLSSRSTSSAAGNEKSACDFQNPIALNGGLARINSCIASLCSTVSLNPDLGGIGVFSSFVTQSCIALLALTLLIISDFWPWLVRKLAGKTPKRAASRNKHTEIVTAALVEFQKSQCYFAAAIQIAALVYNGRFQQNPVSDADADIKDGGLIFAIATSGLVPIIFSLVCIARYGSQTWYITILSTCAFLLSTITLGYSNHLWGSSLSLSADVVSEYISDFAGPPPQTACGPDPPAEILSHWCGVDRTVLDQRIDRIVIPIFDGWNWVVWTNCLLWTVYCILRLAATNASPRLRNRIPSHLKILYAKYTSTPSIGYWTWLIFFNATWSISFGY